MKKFLIALVVVVSSILIYFGVFSYTKNNEKIILISQLPQTRLAKTSDFKHFETFLEDIKFWQENNVSSTDGKSKTTAQKLQISVTDQPQPAGYFVAGVDNQTILSSFRYSVNNGYVTLHIHLNETACQAQKC